MQRAFRRPVEDETVAALHEDLCDRARRREARAFLPPLGDLADRALALPVSADGARARRDAERIPEAWLVAIKDCGPLTDFDRLTLHQAVTIVALELLRGRVAGDTERRLAGDVLAAIVGGELAGAELARRLEPFGLSDSVAALVVQRPNNGRGSPAPVEDALATALREEAAPGLVASTGALTCALVPGLAEEELFGLAERVTRRLYDGLGPGSGSGSGARWPAPKRGGASTRHGAPSRRSPSASSATQNGSDHCERPRAPGHLQGPRLLPAAAVAAGGRGAETVL